MPGRGGRSVPPRGGVVVADVKQVLLGALVMVIAPLGGIAWGISAKQQLSSPDQGPASAGLVLGGLLGLLLGGGYAVTERLRRGSFFLDDPAEVERNRQRGRFNWSYVGIGLLIAAALRSWRCAVWGDSRVGAPRNRGIPEAATAGRRPRERGNPHWLDALSSLWQGSR
jgi:hypothetical protein